MTMKLNQILYQRSRDWIENRPRTGILDAMKRAKPDSVDDKETSSFDNYLRGHIKTSNKTINIRGLFRVPDVSAGERLMIDAEEKEGLQQSDRGNKHEEQNLQIPMSSINNEAWNRLPGLPNESLPNVSKAMMSYPSRKPEFPEPEMIDVEEEQPIDYYINLAKQQPGKKLAFIYKGTRTPRMGITYDGSKVKISSGAPAMEPNYVKDGNLKKTLIDKIYSIKHPPKFTQKDLPPDVEFKATTYYSSDDDEDPDKGGQKILSRKRREKKEPEEEEKIPFSYSGKPKDDDDYPDNVGEIVLTKDKPLPDEDDDDSFVTGKNSDDLRMEVALLESKKDKLMKDIKDLELDFPKMEEYRQELAIHLQKLKEEIDLLENIESSAKKDREKMENKYEVQKKEIENMGLVKKDLEKQLRNLKIKHREEIEEWELKYEESKKESKVDIDELTEDYEKMIRDLQNEISGLRENERKKDYQINQLTKGMESGKAYEMELQNELNDYKENYFNLQNKQNEAKKRIQDLQQELQRRDSSTEVRDLKQHVQEIEEEKNAYLEQIRQKENELNELKQSAVLEHKQILEASRQEIMDLDNAEHNRILSEKDKEMQELKKKYSELEKEYNEAYENIPHYVKSRPCKSFRIFIFFSDQAPTFRISSERIFKFRIKNILIGKKFC